MWLVELLCRAFEENYSLIMVSWKLGCCLRKQLLTVYRQLIRFWNTANLSIKRPTTYRIKKIHVMSRFSYPIVLLYPSPSCPCICTWAVWFLLHHIICQKHFCYLHSHKTLSIFHNVLLIDCAHNTDMYKGIKPLKLLCWRGGKHHVHIVYLWEECLCISMQY